MVRFNLAQATKYPGISNKMPDGSFTMHSSGMLRLQCDVIERILIDMRPFQGYRVAVEIGGSNVANFLADRGSVSAPLGRREGRIRCIETCDNPRKKRKITVHDTESD